MAGNRYQNLDHIKGIPAPPANEEHNTGIQIR